MGACNMGIKDRSLSFCNSLQICVPLFFSTHNYSKSSRRASMNLMYSICSCLLKGWLEGYSPLPISNVSSFTHFQDHSQLSVKLRLARDGIVLLGFSSRSRS